mmetsp:Transcript_19671/g.39007  ORF Transcript_19671/g.39007 Transcript_19671/m.39007 type:complete len:159 (-) Transcript_19671:503-979(-)
MAFFPRRGSVRKSASQSIASQSKWFVGSSSSITSGSCTSAAARATRLRSPPLRDVTGRSFMCATPSLVATVSSRVLNSQPPWSFISDMALVSASSASPSVSSTSTALDAAQKARKERSPLATLAATGLEADGPAAMGSVRTSATVQASLDPRTGSCST